MTRPKSKSKLSREPQASAVRPAPRPVSVYELANAHGLGAGEFGASVVIAACRAGAMDDFILVEPLKRKRMILFHESVWALAELTNELREHFQGNLDQLGTEGRQIVDAFKPRLAGMWQRVRAGERLEADVDLQYADGTAKKITLHFLTRALKRLEASTTAVKK